MPLRDLFIIPHSATLPNANLNQRCNEQSLLLRFTVNSGVAANRFSGRLRAWHPPLQQPP